MGCTRRCSYNHLYQLAACHRVAKTRFRVSRAGRGTPQLAWWWNDMVRGREQLVQYCHPGCNVAAETRNPGPYDEGLRRRRRSTFRACKGRRRKNSFRATERVLGRSHLPRAGSRRTSMGNVAARSGSCGGSLATAPGSDTRSTQVTKPPNPAFERDCAKARSPSILRLDTDR